EEDRSEQPARRDSDTELAPPPLVPEGVGRAQIAADHPERDGEIEDNLQAQERIANESRRDPLDPLDDVPGRGQQTCTGRCARISRGAICAHWSSPLPNV